MSIKITKDEIIVIDEPYIDGSVSFTIRNPLGVKAFKGNESVDDIRKIIADYIKTEKDASRIRAFQTGQKAHAERFKLAADKLGEELATALVGTFPELEGSDV